MSRIGTGANIVFGTWGDNFAKETSKKFAEQAGITPAASSWKELGHLDTWQKAGNNLKLLKQNAGQTDLFQHSLKTVKDTYTMVNSDGYKKEAEIAKDLNKMVSGPGFISKFITDHKTLAEAAKKITSSDLGQSITKAATKATSEGTLLGKVGKLAKGVPFLSSVLFMLPELPKIGKEFKENGVVAGLQQTARSIGRVGVSSLGFVAGATAAGVVGQILCPIPGLGFALGLAGSAVAEKLLDPVVDHLPFIAKNDSDGESS